MANHEKKEYCSYCKNIKERRIEASNKTIKQIWKEK